MDESSSAYLLFGVRGELARSDWRLSSTANYGSGVSADSARWLWVDAAAERAWYGPRLSARLAASAYGLRYTDPFDYTAYAAELSPSLSWNIRAFELTAMPRLSAGTWESGKDQGDISVFGGSLKTALGFGTVTTAITGESYDATNGALDGAYRGLGFEVAAAAGPFEFGTSVKRWQNPNESEWGYSAFVSTAIGAGLQLDIQAARSVTDPVLASPGSFGASVGLSWRIFSRGGGLERPVAAVGPVRAGGRVVTFTVESETAASMSVSGSFSEWQPVPMRRSGKAFIVEMAVPPGIHHYGFLVNGVEWYLPDTAQGVIDDGFGRRNATLVIEGE